MATIYLIEMVAIILAIVLENINFTLVDSVSKKTNYVLAGGEAGSKLTKAQNLGVAIISEEQFIEMIQDK